MKDPVLGDATTSPLPLHSLDEASELLGIGLTKMFELLGNGAIRSVTIGRRRLIPHDGLVDFVRDSEAAAP